MTYINSKSRQSLRQPKTGHAVVIDIGGVVYAKFKSHTVFDNFIDSRVKNRVNTSVRDVVMNVTHSAISSIINSL